MPKQGRKREGAAGEVARYQALYGKVCRVSGLAVGKLFAARDPRVEFIQGLEDGRVLARVELNALARLVTDHLGVKPEVWLRCLNEELEAELQRLEKEAGVTGYDDKGNPILGGIRP
jgi:hypothetical protein